MSYTATINDALLPFVEPLWESVEWDTAHDAYKAAQIHIRATAPNDQVIHKAAGVYEIWGQLEGTHAHVATLVIEPDDQESFETPDEWLARVLDTQPRQRWWRRIQPSGSKSSAEHPDIAPCGQQGVMCRADGNTWIPETAPTAATGWFGRATRADWTRHLQAAAAQVRALDTTAAVLQAHRSQQPTQD